MSGKRSASRPPIGAPAMPTAPAAPTRVPILPATESPDDVGEVQDGDGGPQAAADAVDEGDQEHSAAVGTSGYRGSTMRPRGASDSLSPPCLLALTYVLIHNLQRGNTIWDQWDDGQGNCRVRRTRRGRGLVGAGRRTASGARPRRRARGEPGDGRHGVQGLAAARDRGHPRAGAGPWSRAAPAVASRRPPKVPDGLRDLAGGHPDPALLPGLVPPSRLSPGARSHRATPRLARLEELVPRLARARRGADGARDLRPWRAGSASGGCCRWSCAPGDAVAMEDPGYHHLLDLVPGAGAAHRPGRRGRRGHPAGSPAGGAAGGGAGRGVQSAGAESVRRLLLGGSGGTRWSTCSGRSPMCWWWRTTTRRPSPTRRCTR